ncbi:MAG: zf-HC2 domain-containing protein [Planctomycetes bacterium]|nr:zf-HC2 domain-containing protein [Planctomycetota bacterium]
MKCDQVVDLLSQFYDGELDATQAAAMRTHLAQCGACAAEVAAFADLSEAARMLSEPEPPADLWSRIACALERPARVATTSRPAVVRLRRLAALAALVLIALYTGWLAYQSSSATRRDSHHSSIPVVDLGPYLDQVAKGPRIAIARHPSTQMSPAEAARHVQFRVLKQAELPEGYSLDEGYLVRIEGCSVVQFKYLRGSEVCLLFQYSRGQPVVYGDRPVLATRVNGKAARIVQGDGCLAASWETNGTAVSLIGPRDMSELVRLMAFVDQHLMEDKR